VKAGRASPKSQILSLQSLFASMFFGFKSRWNTLAVVEFRRARESGRESCGKVSHEMGEPCARK
jgi:hypothetical protein